MAIRSERVFAVGSTSEMGALAGMGTRVVDLHRRFAMPGFNDAHIHLGSGGEAKLKIDLEGVRSLADFQQCIRARLKEPSVRSWQEVPYRLSRSKNLARKFVNELLGCPGEQKALSG